ncbi:MAG: NADH-quinone oxidoreductase subunit N [Planctomycetota bacterium]
MAEKIATIWPEIVLFITTCVVMILGLSPNKQWRSLCLPASVAGLVIAGILAAWGMREGGPVADTALPLMPGFVKVTIAVVGVLLVIVQAGLIDRREEALVSTGRPFNPLRTNRAEYFSLVLFSLTGLMLCASASDLIWLFLALELTSLPTYVMVAMSSSRDRAQEAAVKYFYLGALGAATFLYGFVMLYGGTGTLKLGPMAEIIATEGINPITLIGLLLTIAGLGFKIAAVPMHFYTADVYQGAAAPVTAFLAFVPKTAGFIALLLVCATVGWRFGESGDALPESLRVMLWVMAAVTMTVGNVLAILQNSVKRVLAYSSIAHSGYMLVGLLAGPGDGSFPSSGVSAVLFYLAAYGITNTGAFAVIASLERRAADRGEPLEVDSFDDLRGLWKREPALGVVLAIVTLSLLGFPPLLGFMAKLPLFTAGISSGEIALVVILGLNSAIAAFYYLRIVKAAMIDDPKAEAGSADAASRHPSYQLRFATGMCSAVGVIGLSMLAGQIAGNTTSAGSYVPPVVGASEAAEGVFAVVEQEAAGEARTETASSLPTS